MYWSPSSPEVRILAAESFGNLKRSSTSSATTPWKVLGSSEIDLTRPTTTPALRTGAWTLRPPMLSKRAVSGYVVPLLKLPRLAAFSARNSSPRMPSSTNSPTSVSMLFLPIDFLFLAQGVENISAVSTKSIASTLSDEITTVRVVA